MAKRKDPVAAAAIPMSMRERWNIMGFVMRNDRVISNEDNVCRALEKWPEFKGMLSYDEFHRRYFVTLGGTRRQLDDTFIRSLQLQLQREFGIPDLKFYIVKSACTMHADKNITNEPKDYFETLKWDGTDRIKYVLSDIFGAAGTEYIHQVSANFFKMIVARVYEPGCKVDNIIVFKGPQGQYKSTAFEVLMGKGMYLSVTSQITNKDFYLDMQGKLLCEVAELDSFKGADVSRIKSVLSTSVDTFRAPYASASQDHPRQGIFVGSTNESYFLKDTTGNRRYWIVRCDGSVNIDSLKEQRDQLFAEAVHRYKNKESWWEVPEAEQRANAELYRQPDTWEDIIQEYLVGHTQITTKQIMSDALTMNAEKQTPYAQQRVGEIMKLHGWKSVQPREGSKKGKRRWIKIESDDRDLDIIN